METHTTAASRDEIVLGPGQRGWRAAKPACPCEAEALFAIAERTKPENVDIERFGAWLMSLVTDRHIFGAPRGNSVLAKYRRVLVELRQELDVDHEPLVHRCGDVAGELAAPPSANGREPETAGQPPRIHVSVKLAAAA